MCGIIGYVGKRDAVEELVAGLYKLEYRGYDSSGLSVYCRSNNKIITEKKVGRIDNLNEATQKMRDCGYGMGIAHTRWATHGKPSDENSHPHSDSEYKVSVVHNGIIENYAELKAELMAQGEVFSSETDTEVVAKLLAKNYSGDPFESIRKTLSVISGSYALAIMFYDIPDCIYAAKKDSPLLCGFGNGEKYLASDMTAFISRTREYLPLSDGQIAKIDAQGLELYDSKLNKLEYKTMTASWDYGDAELGSYSCYMEKEINEQPAVARKVLEQRIVNSKPDFSEDGLELSRLAKAKRIIICACGTAMHAGLFAKSLFEKLARIPTDVCIASEFRYADPILDDGCYSFVISQSGETADTLAALRMLKSSKVPTAAIVNVVGSTIAREADTVLYTNAGPEIAVASTKAYTSQALLLSLIAVAAAKENGNISAELCDEYTRELSLIWNAFSSTVDRSTSAMKTLSEKIKDDKSLFFLGRGADHAAACEASLKLKEISYIHCEAYAAGELKHGTISLITEGTCVIAIATDPALFDKIESNIKEVAARGAYVYLITTKKGESLAKCAADSFILPDAGERFQPLLAVTACQILAMYTAKALSLDVDKPRNLAKSVTVE